ncbi:unnamed protein product, partial [Mesorhabditis belari]|uniref:Uncharacterized protein n=1 Tax=Mesorhabditis belari TaxID=2138241 RepID=A0AAF3F181_9BILA
MSSNLSKESYGYTLPPQDPDCYPGINFHGVRHTFSSPYFFVWAQKPEPIHFVTPKEHERNACKEFLVSLKNCCQGRVIGGFEVVVRLKAGELNKSVASLQQRRQRMLPKLGPFRPDENSSSEEEFLTSKLSSSRTNLLESIKPMSGYQKVSPAEVAKSLPKKEISTRHSNEKKICAGPSVSLQVPQSATQLTKEQPANKEMKIKQVSFSNLAASKSVANARQIVSFVQAEKEFRGGGEATPSKPKPLLKKKEQTFATALPTGKTLRTPLLDLKNKPMPSQHFSHPRIEPKNEKTNFATPFMRKPGTSHASRVVMDAPNTQQRPPPGRSQLSQEANRSESNNHNRI